MNDNGGVIAVFRAKLESFVFRSDFVFGRKGQSDNSWNTHTHVKHYSCLKLENPASHLGSKSSIPIILYLQGQTNSLTGNQFLEKYTFLHSAPHRNPCDE